MSVACKQHRSSWQVWALTFCALAVCSLAAPAPARAAGSLSALLAQASQDGHYEPATRAELRQAEALFRQMFQRDMSPARLRDPWRELGFDLAGVEMGGQTIWILREVPEQRRGRGFFALRTGAKLPIALQAPHSFFDTHTRQITRKLFQESQVTAAAWNTVHRKRSDLAHTRDSHFSAFTRAFITAVARPLVVQLHGFAPAKRRSPAAGSADMIISGGTRLPPPWARQAAAAWAQQFAYGAVRFFPFEVDELGGTTNAQGEIVRAAGRDGFLHFELSRSLRRRLREEASVRAGFLQGLSRSYEIMSRE